MSGLVQSSRSFTPDHANDPAKLAAIGRTVRERLRALPGVIDLGGSRADLLLVPGFLSEEQCRTLVQVIDSRIGPSSLFEGTQIDGFRTSSTHYFDDGDPAVSGLAQRIHALLGIEPRHAETLQGQRYEAHQQYKHHFDYFMPGQPYWPQERRRGGQRSWTAMIFLNRPEAGGETDFRELGVRQEPRTGALLVWNNMDAGGLPNPATLHAGLPVAAGSKYVITQWYRQDHWSLALR